jgi:fluoride exporter
MIRLLLVGTGGFIGSVLRFTLAGLVQGWSRSTRFPYGTLAVNLLGCFVIGLLAQLAESRAIFSTETRALVFVGLLGGFTTFSAFGYETYGLLRDGALIPALLYVVGHLVAGLAAVWLGSLLARQMWA